MKTYKMKRVVVGILLVMLTLGFCVVGTGAASADQKVGPDQMGQGGPMTGQGFGRGGQGGPMDGQSLDGETPPEMPEGAVPDGEPFPGGFGQNGESASNGQFSRDGGFGPGGQRDFGGHGGFGRDGGPHGADNDVLKAIDALEDGETKTNLETLMARDALNEALKAAGIDVSMSEAPEKPALYNGTRPEDPANGGRQNVPNFLNRENLENIDLDDEAQIQTLFQQFVSWLRGSNT